MTRTAGTPHLERATVLFAVALVGALIAAGAAGYAAAAAQGYPAAGYLRLVVACVWERFDRWGPVAAAVALVPLAGAALLGLRARPGRRLLRIAVVLLLIVGGLRGASALDGWRLSRGPNVLLISIDTLRADHLGTYGSRLPTSPTIDRRLAGEGVTFEEVYSQSPKTTPSHMTMLTSLYPCVHGVELWETNTPGAVLNPAVHTLAEVLKNAGYETAAFTAGTNLHRSRGFDQGFDVYKHGQQLPRATEWIRRHQGRKWFVFFHTFDVHDPYAPPEALIRLFDSDYHGPVLDAVRTIHAGVNGWERGHQLFWKSVDPHDPATVRFVTRLYDAAIRHMDEATVAPLLDLLDGLDLARGTLVVFTSDHGEAFREHGRFLHEDLYAGTLRVPLILRYPGRLPAGRRVAGPVRLLDLMPTVLDLLDLPTPRDAQGRSVAGLARADRPSDTPPILSEHNNALLPRVFESVRTGPLTYIVDGGTEMLFDLAHDPGEMDDLAARRPADTEAMRTLLAGWRSDCREGAARLGTRGDGVEPDEATRKRLRALGYLE